MNQASILSLQPRKKNYYQGHTPHTLRKHYSQNAFSFSRKTTDPLRKKRRGGKIRLKSIDSSAPFKSSVQFGSEQKMRYKIEHEVRFTEVRSHNMPIHEILQML